MRAVVMAALAVFLSGCASIDVVGAYRLSRQDYKTIDPALWRAAGLSPDGVTLNDLRIELGSADGEPAEFRFIETEEAENARGLPTAQTGERLSVYRLSDEGLEDARAAQAVWASDERDEDRSVSVNFSIAMSREFQESWCSGRENLFTPVWVRIDPEAGYRRILKPDAMDRVLSASKKAQCAASQAAREADDQVSFERR